jgi:hypothetical protein
VRVVDLVRRILEICYGMVPQNAPAKQTSDYDL